MQITNQIIVVYLYFDINYIDLSLKIQKLQLQTRLKYMNFSVIDTQNLLFYEPVVSGQTHNYLTLQ